MFVLIEKIFNKYYDLVFNFFIIKINLVLNKMNNFLIQYENNIILKLLFLLTDEIINDINIFYNKWLNYKDSVNIIFSFKKIIKIIIHIFLFFSGITVVIGLLLYIFFFLKYIFKYVFIILDFFILKYNNLYFHIRLYILIKYICTQFFIKIPLYLIYIKVFFFYIIKFIWLKNFIKNYILIPIDKFLYNLCVTLEDAITNTTTDFNFNFNFFYFRSKIKKIKNLEFIIFFINKKKLFIIYYFKFYFKIFRFFILIKKFFRFFFRIWFWLYLEIYLLLIRQSLISSYFIICYYIVCKISYNLLSYNLFFNYFCDKIYLKKDFFRLFLLKRLNYLILLYIKKFYFICKFIFIFFLDIIIKNFFFIIVIKYYKLLFYLMDKYFFFYMNFVGLLHYYSFWLEVHSILFYPLRAYKINIEYKNFILLYLILRMNEDLFIFYKILIKMFFISLYIHLFKYNNMSEKDVDDYIDNITKLIK